MNNISLFEAIYWLVAFAFIVLSFINGGIIIGVIVWVLAAFIGKCLRFNLYE